MPCSIIQLTQSCYCTFSCPTNILHAKLIVFYYPDDRMYNARAVLEYPLGGGRSSMMRNINLLWIPLISFWRDVRESMTYLKRGAISEPTTNEIVLKNLFVLVLRVRYPTFSWERKGWVVNVDLQNSKHLRDVVRVLSWSFTFSHQACLAVQKILFFSKVNFEP